MELKYREDVSFPYLLTPVGPPLDPEDCGVLPVAVD